MRSAPEHWLELDARLRSAGADERRRFACRMVDRVVHLRLPEVLDECGERTAADRCRRAASVSNPSDLPGLVPLLKELGQELARRPDDTAAAAVDLVWGGIEGCVARGDLDLEALTIALVTACRFGRAGNADARSAAEECAQLDDASLCQHGER